jgi:hypothetical protein
MVEVAVTPRSSRTVRTRCHRAAGTTTLLVAGTAGVSAAVSGSPGRVGSGLCRRDDPTSVADVRRWQRLLPRLRAPDAATPHRPSRRSCTLVTWYRSSVPFHGKTAT